MSEHLPRGYRLSNPGNMRKSGEQWNGEVPSDDKDFKRFGDLQHGVRAAAKLILNYRRIYRLDTVEKIIGRWAPPNENDTGAYVHAIAAACGVGPQDPFDPATKLVDMMRAIFRHENGRRPDGSDWVDEPTLKAGCALALRG